MVRADHCSLVAERVPASAVWFAGPMGLLDDAIREHLELKRRRGADPGEVARAEREALDPGFADEPAPSEADFAPPAGALQMLDAEASPSAPATAAGQPRPGPGLSSLGQDTAELDMLSVFEGQHEGAAAPAPAGPVPAGDVRAALSVDAAEEESLEWEMPPAPAGDEPAAGVAHGELIADADWHGTGGERSDAEESRPGPGGSDSPGDVPGQERLTFE